MSRAAKQEALNHDIAEANFTAIQAISQIVPAEGGDFDYIEIIGNGPKGRRRKILIDAQAGAVIRQVHWQMINEPVKIKGEIVELSVRSNTFIIRRRGGREVTCAFPTEEVKAAAFAAFRDGMKIEVKGDYTKRKRRDYMVLDEIYLPDGRVLRREDE